VLAVRIASLAAISGLLLSAFIAYAQCDSWRPVTGFASTNAGVTEIIVIDPDDTGPIAPRLLVAGSFTAAGSVAANRLAIFDPQTRVWSPVGSGLNGGVSEVLHLSGDDYLLGGSFTSAGGVTANRIARVNIATGVFSPLVNLSGDVTTLTKTDNDTVYVGGTFQRVNNQVARDVIRLNPTTGAWTNLNFPYGSIVRSLVAVPGGDVIAGGSFTFNQNYFARFVAATQTWIPVRSIGEIFEMIPLSNGQVGVAGNFLGYVARFDPATNLFASFTSGVNWTQGGPAATVNALAQSGDDLLVGGYFNILTNPNRPANGLARFSLNNPSSQAIASGVVVSNADKYPNALASLPDGRLFVGGTFDFATTRSTGPFIEVNTVTGEYPLISPRPLAWRTGVASPEITSVFRYANGDYGIAGAFDVTNTALMRGVVRYSPANNTWTTLGNGLSISSGSPGVDAIELADGRTLVAGSLSVPNASIFGMAIFNPATQTWTYPGITFADVSFSPVVLRRLADDTIIVAGRSVTLASGTTLSGILRFNPVTNTWATLGSASSVNALATLPNGDLIVSGDFTTIGGVSAARIARHSFATNSWSAFGGGANARVQVIYTLPDGDLIFAGSFTALGTGASAIVAPNAATFDVQTNTWRVGLAQSSGVTAVMSLANGADGNIYASAVFRQGFSSSNRIARFNPVTHQFQQLTSDSFSSSNNRVYTSPQGIFVTGTLSSALAGSIVVSPGIAEFVPPTITQQPDDVFDVCRRTTVTLSVATSAPVDTYEWQVFQPNGFWISADAFTYTDEGIPQFSMTGGTTNQFAISTRATMFGNRPYRFRCIITSPCGNLVTREVSVTAPTCDCVDFNNDGIFPQDTDASDFIDVLAGSSCPTCNDIDFNNNGVYSEDQDIIDFFNVLAGGACG
jgi:hypothetical protein